MTGHESGRIEGSESGLQCGQYFIDVSIDLHFSKQGLHGAVGIDHERAAFNAPIFLAVHAFFFIDAVGRRHRLLFVAQ